ncbi:hypothetical protein [Streptomyces yaizuensis]|uniref:Uncharacterized protein n=1 Tax=Streptomyces yaizuensis TaxID=2989713 RepID=A0ABQ5PBH1_9ACTN|nr:hypothetical protein [Streptomyces sp. YSPA8]GLF99924.1 hypothetical protein SYYSPA8_36525 [Streptomyces sp. YSPA8]
MPTTDWRPALIYTEAQHLYPGAAILNGLALDIVATVTRDRSSSGPAVRLTFEPAPHTPARVSVHDPEDRLLATAVPKVAWKIRYHHPSGQHLRGTPAQHSSSRLSAVYTVRDFYAHSLAHLVVDEIVEEHSVMTHTPICLDDLPGPSEPTPAPPSEHGHRSYTLHRIGPTVLSTGDAVRSRLEQIQDIHVREHGPVHEDRGVRVLQPAKGDFSDCGRCVTGPYDGTVLEVTVERTYYRVTLDDLPEDWDYELGPEMAHARHQTMSTSRLPLAHRLA